MIRRMLFIVLAIAALVWWMRKLLATSRPRPQVSHGTGQSTQDSGRMVRDRVCNTFLPESRALSARVDDQEHFFCSEKCREEFLSRHAARSA